ncbi:MAG TPA: hypothetical protein VIJ68_02030 [Candidatus Saccharimonadales bacterium]
MAQLTGEGSSVKRVVSTAAKASLGLLMISGGSAAAQTRSAEGRAAASVPAVVHALPSLPRNSSAAKALEQALERRVPPLLDPRDTVLWGGPNGDAQGTTLPIATSVNGQAEYIIPLHTGRTLSRHEIATMSLKRYNRYLAESYKTLDLKVIPNPVTIVDGTQYSSALDPNKFLDPIGTFAGKITDNTLGFQPAVHVRLSDGSAPLEPIGFTAPNPDSIG